jgi:solute carrier family 25 phosphate transporter 23/24/25/41
MWERLVAGSAAGVSSQSAIYPLDYTKTRIAVAATGHYKGIVDCVVRTVREDGALALYKGLGPALAGIVPAVGIDLALYSKFKDMYVKLAMQRQLPLNPSGFESGRPTQRERRDPREPGVLVSMACGAVSSIIGGLCSYPLALVRTKLVTQGMAADRPVLYTGAVDCLVKTFKTQGIPGLYRGQVPSMLKTVPSMTVAYGTFEIVKSQLVDVHAAD